MRTKLLALFILISGLTAYTTYAIDPVTTVEAAEVLSEENEEVEATAISDDAEETVTEGTTAAEAPAEKKNTPITIALGISLMIIMFGMGLSLVPADFARVFQYPKAVVIGMIGQLVLLPIVGYILTMFIPGDKSAEFALGVMLIAACPGGATSNYLTVLGKGNAALSITLTAISTLAATATIPFIVNFSINKFGMGSAFNFDPMIVIGALVKIVVIPTGLGMLVKGLASNFADKIVKVLNIISMILLTVIILGAIVAQWSKITETFSFLGPIVLALNLITMALGYFLGKITKIEPENNRTLTIEIGIQNGTLAITLGALIMGQEFTPIAMPAATYGILMFLTIIPVIALFRRMAAKETAA